MQPHWDRHVGSKRQDKRHQAKRKKKTGPGKSREMQDWCEDKNWQIQRKILKGGQTNERQVKHIKRSRERQEVESKTWHVRKNKTGNRLTPKPWRWVLLSVGKLTTEYKHQTQPHTFVTSSPLKQPDECRQASLLFACEVVLFTPAPRLTPQSAVTATPELRGFDFPLKFKRHR